MAIVAVSIAPVGEGPSVGAFVGAALRVLEEQDRVRFAPGPMFTTLEGELGEIFALVQRMQEAVFARGAQRVSTVIKVDERRDRSASMEEKLESARRHAGGTARSGGRGA
jgi:uncharacterized protein (TIGR00106 family)